LVLDFAAALRRTKILDDSAGSDDQMILQGLAKSSLAAGLDYNQFA
jgi:hypothetical protein